MRWCSAGQLYQGRGGVTEPEGHVRHRIRHAAEKAQRVPHGTGDEAGRGKVPRDGLGRQIQIPLSRSPGGPRGAIHGQRHHEPRQHLHRGAIQQVLQGCEGFLGCCICRVHVLMSKISLQKVVQGSALLCSGRRKGSRNLKAFWYYCSIAWSVAIMLIFKMCLYVGGSNERYYVSLQAIPFQKFAPNITTSVARKKGIKDLDYFSERRKEHQIQPALIKICYMNCQLGNTAANKWYHLALKKAPKLENLANQWYISRT